MLTVHLLRDNQVDAPGYSVFATNNEEQILAPTVYNTKLYSDAALQANVLFDVLKALDQQAVACYIETAYENPLSVSFTVDKFTLRKIGNHVYYAALIELYESYACLHKPKAAFYRVVSERILNKEDAEILRRLLNLKFELPRAI